MGSYTYSKQFKGNFDEAVERVNAALAEQGFGILSDIDVAATLKKKLDVDIPAYRILGACNPSLAHRAIQADPDIGALLPCNVVVRQEQDAIGIEVARPDAMFRVTSEPQLEPVMREAEERLQRALEAL